MRRLLVCLALLAAPLAAQTRHAPGPRPGLDSIKLYERYVIIPDSIRDRVAQDWDEDGDERAYCAAYTHEKTALGVRYQIEALVTAKIMGATTDAVAFSCLGDWIVVHSHRGGRGVEAHLCQPSMHDLVQLYLSEKPFELLICDDQAIVPYYPDDLFRHIRSASVAAARSRTGTYVFAGALAAGVTARMAMGDKDPGGYQDGWTTKAAFPDKFVHALVAAGLTSVAVDLKVNPWVAAFGVSLAGVLFEVGQGYVSEYDILANITGAALAAAWRTWRK